MALFFVAALQDSSPAVDTAVQLKIPASDAYEIESGKWIVDMSLSTSKDLSEFLGLAAAVRHFILPVRGYYGRSQPDLWEWLAAKSSPKANA